MCKNISFHNSNDSDGGCYDRTAFPVTTILMAVFLIVGSVVGSKIISGKILKK